MGFIEWLLSFPMPDGKPAKTIWPELIAFIVINSVILLLLLLLIKLV